MVEKFLSYLRFEKNYSPNTLKSYRGDLISIENYLHENYETELQEATTVQLRSWMVDSLEKGLSGNSIGRKVSSLKSFYKWLKKIGVRTSDPTSKLVVPKKGKRLPSFVKEQNVVRFSTDEVFDQDAEGKRNAAIIELLYNTGIRSAELINLQIDDFDKRAGTIRVIGKRDKERIIPLGNELKKILEGYLDERLRINCLEERPYFFLTGKGKKLYPKLVYRIANKYISVVSSVKKKSPHILRHSFATHMLNRGADINAVKELLGHSSLAATQVYTHNTVEKLIKVYRKSHPKG